MTLKPSELAVLVIDDHQIVRQVVDRNLRQMGFEQIDMAGSATEAQDRMAKKHYDILFVDWILPGKSGYTLMQECRADRAYDGVAFVMVTSESEKHYMIEALKAGASAYITKPVLSDVFKEKVGQVLEWLELKRAENAQKAAGK